MNMNSCHTFQIFPSQRSWERWPIPPDSQLFTTVLCVGKIPGKYIEFCGCSIKNKCKKNIKSKNTFANDYSCNVNLQFQHTKLFWQVENTDPPCCTLLLNFSFATRLLSCSSRAIIRHLGTILSLPTTPLMWGSLCASCWRQLIMSLDIPNGGAASVTMNSEASDACSGGLYLNFKQSVF